MKKLIILIFIISFSCKKEKQQTTTNPPQQVVPAYVYCFYDNKGFIIFCAKSDKEYTDKINQYNNDGFYSFSVLKKKSCNEC
jgi:hypothetical protein